MFLIASSYRIVPFGVNNKFSMPCNITFWGDEENKLYVQNEMNRNGFRVADYNNNMNRSSSFYEPGANTSFGSPNSTVRAPVKVSANVVSKIGLFSN